MFLLKKVLNTNKINNNNNSHLNGFEITHYFPIGDLLLEHSVLVSSCVHIVIHKIRT